VCSHTFVGTGSGTASEKAGRGEDAAGSARKRTQRSRRA